MRTANQIAAEMLKAHPFVFRNSCGMAIDKNGNRFRFGLHPGSSDYIGFKDGNMSTNWQPIFASIEIKRFKDKLSPAQRKWNKVMQEHNAVCEVWSETKDGEIKVLTGKDII
jgi:hypothetical protein